MAEVKWIKLSTEVFCDSGKITQIEAMPEGDTLVVIWFKLLILAGKVNDGGAIYLTPEIPYTDEMLANAFHKPINTVRMAMQIFEKFGMIEIVDDILYLSSWEKYQSTDKLAEIREKNRIAQQKSRAKRKLLQDVNNTSRDSHMTVTGCHAVDIDKEKETDINTTTTTNIYLSYLHSDGHKLFEMVRQSFKNCGYLCSANIVEDFIVYNNSRDWLGIGGESVLENLDRYVIRWCEGEKVQMEEQK